MTIGPYNNVFCINKMNAAGTSKSTLCVGVLSGNFPLSPEMEKQRVIRQWAAKKTGQELQQEQIKQIVLSIGDPFSRVIEQSCNPHYGQKSITVGQAMAATTFNVVKAIVCYKPYTPSASSQVAYGSSRVNIYQLLRDNPSITEKEIELAVCANLPEKTHVGIKVTSESYTFGQWIAVPAYCIQMRPVFAKSILEEFVTSISRNLGFHSAQKEETRNDSAYKECLLGDEELNGTLLKVFCEAYNKQVPVKLFLKTDGTEYAVCWT